MKTKKASNTSGINKRYVVKKPATLNDYIRIYGMTNALLKEAQLLEKNLRPAR